MFQDSYASLDPRMRAGSILREPLIVQGMGSRREQLAKVKEMLGKVGLPESWTERYPHEFSGGQRQRLGFARALMLNPQLIVADEPVSALDVSIQAQVLNMMRDLQRELGLTYLFISHDLSVVRYLSNHIGVMYLGKLVEIGTADEVYLRPAHPYTKGLIESAPTADPATERAKVHAGHHRRAAERDPPAVGLPVPHPLPAGAGDLLHRRAGAEAVRRRQSPGRLPLRAPAPGRGDGTVRRRAGALAVAGDEPRHRGIPLRPGCREDHPERVRLTPRRPGDRNGRQARPSRPNRSPSPDCSNIRAARASLDASPPRAARRALRLRSCGASVLLRSRSACVSRRRRPCRRLRSSITAGSVPTPGEHKRS